MVELVKPSVMYENEIKAFKQEMVEFGDNKLSGCGGLDRFDDISLWLKEIELLSDQNRIPSDSKYVEATQWLLVNEENRILGMINIRHYLNDYLMRFGGHIGYSIRPSERRVGYGKKQLELALMYLKDRGLKKVLITCDDNNIGSIKTIEACNGVLENKIKENNSIIRRYWIDNNI